METLPYYCDNHISISNRHASGDANTLSLGQLLLTDAIAVDSTCPSANNQHDYIISQIAHAQPPSEDANLHPQPRQRLLEARNRSANATLNSSNAFVNRHLDSDMGLSNRPLDSLSSNGQSHLAVPRSSNGAASDSGTCYLFIHSAE